MAQFEFYEIPLDVKAKYLKSRSEIAANKVLLAGYRLILLLRKVGYRRDEARAPAGNSDGGQWAREDGSGDKRTRKLDIKDIT